MEDDDDEAQQIPLPNVRADILARVVEFMNLFREEPMKEIPSVISHTKYVTPNFLLNSRNIF